MQPEIDFLEDVLHVLELQYKVHPGVYSSNARVMVINRIAALKSVEAGQQPATTAMPKLPDFDMENVRCLESFISHRACIGAPVWSAWARAKEFIVAVRRS